MDREALMRRLRKMQSASCNCGRDIIGGSAKLHDVALRNHVERQERLVEEAAPGTSRKQSR